MFSKYRSFLATLRAPAPSLGLTGPANIHTHTKNQTTTNKMFESQNYCQNFENWSKIKNYQFNYHHFGWTVVAGVPTTAWKNGVVIHRVHRLHVDLQNWWCDMRNMVLLGNWGNWKNQRIQVQQPQSQLIFPGRHTKNLINLTNLTAISTKLQVNLPAMNHTSLLWPQWRQKMASGIKTSLQWGLRRQKTQLPYTFSEP